MRRKLFLILFLFLPSLVMAKSFELTNWLVHIGLQCDPMTYAFDQENNFRQSDLIDTVVLLKLVQRQSFTQEALLDPCQLRLIEGVAMKLGQGAFTDEIPGIDSLVAYSKSVDYLRRLADFENKREIATKFYEKGGLVRSQPQASIEEASVEAKAICENRFSQACYVEPLSCHRLKISQRFSTLFECYAAP